MGYCGLDSVTDSDRAADLAYGVFKEMVKALRKGLKEKGNEFNTNGVVNVALFIEEFLQSRNFTRQEEIVSLVIDTKTQLVQYIDKCESSDWDDERNKDWHIKAYKRMLKSLNKFLEP